MRRPFKILIFSAAILILLGSAVYSFPLFALQLFAPHSVQPSRASLDSRLSQKIADALQQKAPSTADEVLAFALKTTGEHLHFGLDHKTQFSFGENEREANCIEYAHLFVKIYSMAAKKAGLSFKAYAVHSANAKVLGARVPMPGWQDHDWVCIELWPQSPEPKRLYVDPTLYDAGFGWNIQGSVKGTIVLPK